MSQDLRAGDELIFVEDSDTTGDDLDQAAPWRILIIDDDPEVHQATMIAVSSEIIAGRPLVFLHAYSSREARSILATTPDIAVILLDVVMEQEDAGLRLVRVIREDLGLSEVRIVLRTGQPGYAPELQVIREYDINDYKTKSELTRTRLVTALTTAVRSYEQLRKINASRHGLNLIVHSAAELFARRALVDFSEGVLTQIAALLGMAPEGLICVQNGCPNDPPCSGDCIHVVGAAGRFRDAVSRPLRELSEPRIIETIERCIADKANSYSRHSTALYLGGSTGREGAVFIDRGEPLSEMDRQLIEVFCVNIAVGFENVNLFQNLTYQAYNDGLCRLPNRLRLIELLDDALRDGHMDYSLILVDIDHFSVINDALGYRHGDLLLQSVANRLRDSLDAGVTVARVAGDTFAMLGTALKVDPQQVMQIFAAPFDVENYHLPVRASLGVAQLTEVDGAGIDVLRSANIALKRAKGDRSGRHCTYTRSMAAETRERLTLLHDLRDAIEHEQLEVYYQPKICLDNGRICGAEALLRWKYRTGDFIAPELVVSIAEYSGLIFSLGEWVMRAACKQAVLWRQQGHTDFSIAVNVSMNQFRSPDFIASVERCLADTGLPAAALELEITETIAMLDMDTVIRALSALRALGVRIAVDDFGTGFSSLAYLHRLPINTLKIDRAFVRDLPQGENGHTIADTILRLGEGLHLDIVAEGVETLEQADYLRQRGCGCAQGYLYSPPADAARFEAWRKSYEA